MMLRRFCFVLCVLLLFAGAVLCAGALVAMAAPAMQVGLPTSFDSNYLLAAALVGAVIPALIALINQWRWSPERKGLVALLICTAAGTLLAYTQALLDPADVLRSILIVFTIAQVLYQTFWKPSGIADAIEAHTSIR